MILVDELTHYPDCKLVHKHWCHMISLSGNLNELHKFAKKIGLKASWSQGDHYDLTESYRGKAIMHGGKRGF